MATVVSPSRPAQAISLVLPAFNEEAVIEQAIWEAHAALTRAFADHEIIVVDDGSTDDTAGKVRVLQTMLPRLRLISHVRNQGYGSALRSGFSQARHPLVAFTDADCQFDLSDLAPMAQFAERYPIVVGHRVDRKDPFRRRMLSRGYNALIRTLLGSPVRDVDCALKVFRRDVLRGLIPESRGFFVNTEMMTRAVKQGLEIVEVPVAHRPRLSGDSKVSLWEVPRVFRMVVRYWWQQRSVTQYLMPNVVHHRVPVVESFDRSHAEQLTDVVAK